MIMLLKNRSKLVNLNIVKQLPIINSVEDFSMRLYLLWFFRHEFGLDKKKRYKKNNKIYLLLDISSVLQYNIPSMRYWQKKEFMYLKENFKYHLYIFYQSKIYNKKMLSIYKKNLTLTLEQREILFGLLLGGSSVFVSTYYIKFSFSSENYASYIYSLFWLWFKEPPKKCNKNTSTLYLITYTHYDFKFFYNLFYKKGVVTKFLPLDIFMFSFLTERSLAFWFMETCFVYVLSKQVSLSLNFYLSKSDLILICKVFLKNFGLKIYIEVYLNVNILFFKNSSYEKKFLKIVKPYLTEECSNFLNL